MSRGEAVEVFGAAGIGLVIGWLLPAVRASGERAFAASAGMLGAVAGALALAISLEAAAAGLAAGLGAALAHATWRAELARTRRQGI